MARKYRAFISYRHAEVDSRIAAEVQRSLERFHIPAAARKETGIKSLAPIFRDKEELPVTAELSDDIDNALANSSHLIVICSPRTAESTWVQREIEAFLKTHSVEDVLTVLAEGEPYDVIPEVLLKRPSNVTLEDGTTQEVLVDAEPLSCDFRSPRHRDHVSEVTRLAAAMLGVPYDTLMRRRQHYRRRIAAAFACAAVAIIAYGAWSLVTIREDYRQTLISQSKTLARDAMERYEDGNAMEAIELSLAALPGEGGERPVVAEAELALQQASRAYVPITQDQLIVRARVADYDAARAFSLGHTIAGMNCARDGSLVTAWSDSGHLACWDTVTGMSLLNLSLGSVDIRDACLLEGRKLVVAYADAVSCYSLDDGSEVWRVAPMEDGFSDDEADDALFGAIDLIVMGAMDVDQKTGKIAVYDWFNYEGRILLLDAESGSCDAIIPLEELGGTVTITAGVSMDVGEGVCALPRDVDEGYDVQALALVDLETGKTCLSEDTFKAITDLTVLPQGKVLVTSLDGGMYEGSRVWGRNDSLTTLCAYAIRLSCVDVHTGKTLWTRVLDAWQPLGRSDAFMANLKVGEDGPEEMLVWYGANLCAWLDADSGELRGTVEVPAHFVSAWARPIPGDETTSYIEGCLADGEYAVCMPDEERVQSVACYPRDVTAARSSEVGEFVTAGDAVVLYAPGQGDASWQRLTDAFFDYENALFTPSGVLLLDQLGTGHDDVPTAALFDLAKGEEVWTYSARDMAGEEELQCLGFISDESAVVLRVSSRTEEDEGTLLRVRLDDGSVTQLPKAEQVTSTESNEGSWGEETTIAGDYVISCIWSEDDTSGRLCATNLTTKESTVYDIATAVHQRGVGSPLGQALVATDSATIESDDLPTAYQCMVLNAVTGQKWQLEEPVLARKKDPNCLDALWGADGTLYARTVDAVVAYGISGKKHFAIELGTDKLVGMELEGSELWMGLIHDGRPVLRWFNASDGAMLEECSLDVPSKDETQLDWSLVRWSSLPPSSTDGKNMGVLFVEDTAYVIDRTGTVYQIAENCYGYDPYADSFMVAAPEPYSSGFGCCRRYTLDGLIARGQELLGTSRMSESRRQEFGL